MKFLVEYQIPFEKTKSQLYKHRLPYLEASAIYLSLYDLKYDVLALLDEIIFIASENEIQDTYQSGFKRYSADVRNYQDEKALISEIFNRFPEPDKIQDIQKRDKIETLIKKSTVFSFASDKQQTKLIKDIVEAEDDYLFYLPFVKTFSNELIMSLAARKCKLFSSGKAARFIQESKTFFVESTKYQSFLTNLKQVRKELEDEDDNLRFAWDYRSKDILELFDNGFSDKFKHLLKEGRNRIQINGEEVYLAKKAIEKLLSGRDRYYYYMPRDLAKLEEINQSLAVFNFDSIGHPNDFNKLYNAVKELPSKYYVLLQAIKKAGSQYFSYYDEINTPSQEEIDDKIIEVFIYLLLERGVYADNHCRLFALIGLTTFKKLLPKYGSLENLSEAISEFHAVTFDDLINNVSFWLYLDYAIRATADDKNRTDNEPKPKILFAHHGDNWEIHGLGHSMSFDYSTHMGILYLAVVLKSERELNASQVKEIAYRSISEKKYLDKLKSDKLEKKDLFDILETDRKTISSAINQIKVHRQFKSFIDKYVKFGAKTNSFLSKNEIEVEVDDPNIKDSFFQ